MIERGGGLRLLNESRFVFLRSRKMLRQKFYGDSAVELRILGFVDDTHPAFSQLFKDFVMRNCGTDHNAVSLPRKLRRAGPPSPCF